MGANKLYRLIFISIVALVAGATQVNQQGLKNLDPGEYVLQSGSAEFCRATRFVPRLISDDRGHLLRIGGVYGFYIDDMSKEQSRFPGDPPCVSYQHLREDAGSTTTLSRVVTDDCLKIVHEDKIEISQGRIDLSVSDKSSGEDLPPFHCIYAIKK